MATWRNNCTGNMGKLLDNFPPLKKLRSNGTPAILLFQSDSHLQWSNIYTLVANYIIVIYTT